MTSPRLIGLADRVSDALARGEAMRLSAREVVELARCGAWDAIYRPCAAEAEVGGPGGDNVIDMVRWRKAK